MFLVTGANGQLGTALQCLLKDQAVYIDREDLDLADEAAVKAYFAAHKFDFVINCAAYTAVDRAEGDAENAHKVNALAPLYLAKYGRNVVHISTDYVFDGTGCKPYNEDDAANPQSVYGKTKREGELNVLNNADTAVVIRTAWLYSPHGGNFVKTMRRLGKERGMLKVIFDQVGTPTYAGDLAAAIVHILPQIRPGMKSIYHFSNEGVCSWYDFARAIIEMSGLSCDIRPIESWEYTSKAARPPYSVLNKAKIKKDFGIRIRHWRDALRECIDNLEENNL